jgi:ABC-type sugar transport system ATPase subunit
MSSLNIRAYSDDQIVATLSGGNQQKLVLAKWLATDAKIMLLDEPTKGIDVGAKQEIYELIRNLAEEGKGIIVVSSELNELISLCHRILVIHEGRIVTEYAQEEVTREKIIASIIHS